MPRTQILLVDQDPDTRVILREVLEHEGYGVVEAATGAEGLALARASAPDVIIGEFPLDIPGQSLFTDHVRSAPELAGTRILVVTARALEQELEAAAAVGDAVLVKPVSPTDVVAEVRRLLAPGAG